MSDYEIDTPTPSTRRNSLQACAVFTLVLSLTTILWGLALIYFGFAYTNPGDTLEKFSMALLIVGFILLSTGLLSTSAFAYFCSLYNSVATDEQTKMK